MAAMNTSVWVVGEAPSETHGLGEGPGWDRVKGLLGVDTWPSWITLSYAHSEIPAKDRKGYKFPSSPDQLGVILRQWCLDPPAAVLFLGRRVANAFKVPNGRLRSEGVMAFVKGSSRYRVVPHPSAVNRLWNDPGEFDREAAAVRALLSLSRANAQLSTCNTAGRSTTSGCRA